MINFLTILFLIGIFIASVQDLRRREVDNYVNFFLLVSGMAFVVFSGIFNKDWKLIVFAFLCFGFMVLIANLLYYGRAFAGGDAKLLIAMSPVFASSSFFATLESIGIFLLLLLFSGAIYGSVFSLGLFLVKFKIVRKDFSRRWRKEYWFVLVLGLIFLFFKGIYFALGVFIILIPILFVFAKSLEVGMTRFVLGRDLREGDWILDKIRYRGRIIKPNWEGLTKKQIRFLKDYKKKVRVKDGLPFVPAFFIAFVVFIFRSEVVSFVFRMIG